MAESFLETLIELDENAILAQLNSIAQELGLINQIFNTSRIYLYYAVFARVWGNITSIIAQYLTNFDLENTTDEALLEMQIKPFVKKNDAKIAKTILQFKRRKNYNKLTSDILIPRDFEVMTEGDDPIIFRTAESRILWRDSEKVLIPAYSVEFGSLNNLSENTLTYFNDAEHFAQIEVTNPYPAYGGSDEETAFDARQRIGLFRYGRDSTKDSIQQMLFENGVSYYGFNIVQYWDGFGTVLICMDVDSEEHYNDVINEIEAQKPAGVKYHYCMAEYIYVNIDVNIKMLIEDNFTPYQKDEIEQHIKTAVETYFANNIYIGRKLSTNRLESYILQYLFDERYDIYEVEVSVESNNSDVLTDLETGQLKIQEYQRLYPNIIYTTIEYNSDL